MGHKDYLEPRDERLERRRDDRDRNTSVMSLVVGGLAVVGLAALIAMALPDIKRYIKISTM